MRKMCVFYRRPVHNNGNEVVFYCKLTATSLWSATFSIKIESTDVAGDILATHVSRETERETLTLCVMMTHTAPSPMSH